VSLVVCWGRCDVCMYVVGWLTQTQWPVTDSTFDPKLGCCGWCSVNTLLFFLFEGLTVQR
jgi:hypothetical protein